MLTTQPLLPGTEVHARGLRWEVVTIEDLGPQKLFRLRGIEQAALGHEMDLLSPFEAISPIYHELQPERAAALFARCGFDVSVHREDVLISSKGQP